VFDPVSAATVKVAAATVFAVTGAYVAGNFCQVGWQYQRAAAFWPFAWGIRGETGQGGEFRVFAGGVVTYQAIHCIFRNRWRLAHIFPAITNVARRTARFVGDDRAAKAVNNLAFTQLLASFRVVVKPCPVGCSTHLLAGFSVAGQAGGGDFRR
jgi:hypothetical protein